MSFFTCFWLLPQNEHFSRSPPSPIRAMSCGPTFLFAVGKCRAGGPPRGYFPTLPVCSGAMRPIKPNRVGGIYPRWWRTYLLPSSAARRNAPPCRWRVAAVTASKACATNVPGCPTGRSGVLRGELAVLQHGVDDPVLLAIRRREDLVAVGVL